MDRSAVRELLSRNRGDHRRAAVAVGVSPQHLSGFLVGRDELAVVKLLRLAAHLRAHHGVQVDIEQLAKVPRKRRGPSQAKVASAVRPAEATP